MPLLAIALDSADRQLVLRWTAEGELPTVARLMSEGSTARLSSPADYLPEAVWPTLTTGCGPGKHGHYNFRCIRPGSYAQVPSPDRSYRRPFWQLLAARDVRTLLVDVPYAEALDDDRVVQLAGWGQRGALRSYSWPPGLSAEVRARHGRYPRGLDEDFDRSVRQERRQLRETLRMVDARTELVRDLLGERGWEVALVDYWEPHTAAHAFHRYLDPLLPGYDEDRAAHVSDALLQVYRRIDAGLERLIAAAPGDTDVLVFSPYGLRPNTNGMQILPRVLIALGYQVPRRPPPLARVAHGARANLPWSIRRHVNARLPPAARMRVMERMWADAVDWGKTRAVAESEHGHGWVRINLRGREPEGTVEPGAEYEDLCAEIAADLRRLYEASSGEPAVADVVRPRDLLHGPHLDELPDLLVRWSQKHFLQAVRHPRIGVIEEDLRDVPKTEHTGEGFLVAAGPRLQRGAELETADIVDLAPTFLYLAGAPVPKEMDGRVLTELVETSALAESPPARAPIPWEDDRWRAD